MMIHPGALGDLVLALPLAQTLAARFDRVDLLAVGERGRLLAGRSAVAQAFDLESPAWTTLFADGRVDPAVAERLGGYDCIVNGCGGEAILANLVRFARSGAVVQLDCRPRSIERSGLHASEFLHRQVFGDAPCPLPAVTPKSGARVPRSLLIHPGSGGRCKCWALECFIEVARIVRDAGWGVSFVLGPVETERHLGVARADVPLALEPPVPPYVTDGLQIAEFDIVAGIGLVELMERIASASAYLGNDAGPTHLSAAAGTPTVGLFCPTDPDVWGPRGRAVQTIRGRGGDGVDWGLDPPAVASACLSLAGEMEKR